MPVASGSSVPACPVFMPVARRTRSTTRLDVMPAGLSMTSQPPRPGSAIILVLQIALDCLAVQQRSDALRGVEPVVEREIQIGNTPQLHKAGDLTLQIRRATPQTRDNVGGVGAPERHHKGRGVAQIGA